MADIDPDSMERMASMLAMLASEDGEADNAGRAVGSFARRLGLTGGDLKMIFMRGMSGGGFSSGTSMPRDEAVRIARENVRLRHSIESAEAIVRGLTQEVASLRSQNEVLRRSSERGKIASQLALVGIVGMLGAALVGAMVNFMGASFPSGRSAREIYARRASIDGPVTPRTDFSTPGPGALARADQSAPAWSAEIREKGAALRQSPDISAPVIATVPARAHVGVRRLVWNAFVQWAEIDVGGRDGYVVTTDVDLP